MITKNYKSIFSYLTALTIGLFLVGCDQEDNTGMSTYDPTSPSLEITISETNVILIEGNQEYTFTANISAAQLVDIKLYAYQVGGDADGDDYTIDGSIVIPAGSTSAKGKLKIVQDDILEETETLKIQVGDNRTANTSQNSAFMDYQILNYTEGDLVIDLSWAMAGATTDDSGEAIDPEDFADMRLLISSTPDNAGDIDEADGSGFESLVLSQDLPDGDYYIVTDFYDANSDIVRDLNLSLNLYQAGLINDDGYDFPNAISNLGTCDLNFYVMSKIIKSGTTYTYEDVSTQSYDLSVVNWAGTDVDYDSMVSTNVDCEGQIIFSLCEGWMVDWWGEPIIERGNVYYTVDAAGIVTIESQYLYTTTFNDAVQEDYYINGTGTLDEATGTLNIQYYIIQDGWDLTEWMFDNGYSDNLYFEAILTLN